MNIYPSFTNLRSHLAHKFFTLRTNARREALWAKLTGKDTTLTVFPQGVPEKSPNRKFVGTEDIPIAQIVGTISRQSDFDNKFRPLNKHLIDRWVEVYLTLEREGWPPILVHRVGEKYYVEDGHHRVSVAQLLGMRSIEAKIWEYPCLTREIQECQSVPCPERSPAHLYPGVTD